MPLLLAVLLAQDPTVSDLIRSLNDNDIRVRRKAADDLFRRGKRVEADLWDAMVDPPSLEASLAVESVLARLGRLEKRTRPLREMLTGRKAVSPDSDAGLLHEGRVVRITEERHFGKPKDDPPRVELDR